MLLSVLGRGSRVIVGRSCTAGKGLFAPSKRGKAASRLPSVMSFHFGSKDYASAFQDVPKPDVPALRKSSLDYLDDFDPKTWYQDPIVTLCNGKTLNSGTLIPTVNALGEENGSQIVATADEVDMIKSHVRTYESPHKDLRVQMRRIEEKLLSPTFHAGFLIGNQCIDFQKQDGVTELEEATMANAIERRLNDMVLESENKKEIKINRKPIYVSCVSNFTNFLDLFRKTIRSIEVGIPCVILGRSNTVQHSFRWSKLLLDMMEEEGIAPGMLTYLSCSLDQIKDITKSCEEYTGNLYTTCSRDLAKEIKSGYPKTVASTQGPNTLIALDPSSPSVQEAIQCSAQIESSGQCTALRHCVVPSETTLEGVAKVFTSSKCIGSASTALRDGVFDGVFSKHAGSTPPNSAQYAHDEASDAYYKISNELPPPDLQEYWRKVVVDFTTMNLNDPHEISKLADWLNLHQPISLAMNGMSKSQALSFGIDLFERTGMVVNTIGWTNDGGKPALTCQARPQEAEVFGEFPPRRYLKDYTLFPVVVPSSNPSYDSRYTNEYLEAKAASVDSVTLSKAAVLLGAVTSKKVKGYCVLLLEYLRDATEDNPKRGFGDGRTAVWGLQRPPIDTTTYLRCGPQTTLDDIAPILSIFAITNAKDGFKASVHRGNDTLVDQISNLGVEVAVEDDASFSGFSGKTKGSGDNVIEAPMAEDYDFSMVGQFTSTFLPIGHLKSTESNDSEFVAAAKKSKKWLHMVD